MVANKKVNLMQASNEWARRPDDERFWTLEEMREATLAHKLASVTAAAPLKGLRFVTRGEWDLHLESKETKRQATLSHYAFGQFCTLTKAPQSYLRELPAPLAANCLNVGIERYEDDSRIMSMLASKRPEGMHVRAALSPSYTRIWNSDVVQNLERFLPGGWRVPPARPVSHNITASTRARKATEKDVLRSSRSGALGGLAVKIGDLIAPAGLYASEKDMFAFLVNEDHPIEVPGQAPLYRGFFIWNSEVGDRSLGMLTFLYNTVCGNHIVWGAENISELNVRHIGDADEKAWTGLKVTLKDYASGKTLDLTSKIKRAKEIVLAKDPQTAQKDDVVDFLYGIRRLGLARSDIDGAYECAVKFPQDHGDSNPKSAWAMSQGLSRLSQGEKYQDARVKLDKAAGEVLQLAF